MRVVAGGLAGAGVGLGLMIIAAAVAGQLPEFKVPAVVTSPQLLIRAALAVIGALAAMAVTGWVAAGFGVGMAGWMLPRLWGVRARRQRAFARSEAVAVWAEMLRDTLAGSAGLREAIAATARVAPQVIEVEVRALDARAERGTLAAALLGFADDLDDPVADSIVTALVIAVERQGSNLSGMLSAIAASTRQQTAMQLRVNATRARTFRMAQLVCGISGSFMGALIVFNRAYLEPFSTLAGQCVLMVATVLVGVALWSLEKLSRPVIPPRLIQPVGGR